MECRTHSADDDPGTETEKVSEVTDSDYIWTKRFEVLYRCALSSRYHRRRERFFEFFERATNASALIGGSAAFAAATNAELVKIAAAVVASTSVVGLVFSFADKARRHASLAECYKRIEAEILRHGDFDYTEEQVNNWRAMIAETEANEPPTLRTLVSLCQNDLAIAANQPEKFVAQPFIKRALAQYFDIEPTRSR